VITIEDAPHGRHDLVTPITLGSPALPSDRDHTALPDARRPTHAGRPGTAPSAPARGLLTEYTRTLAALLVSMAVLLLGWRLVADTEWVSSNPWWTAVAATTGWALAVATWLRGRGWRRRTVHVVTWAAPAALLLPLTWIGWVLPSALALWAPLTSLIAVACAMAADPLGAHDPCPSDRARVPSCRYQSAYGPATEVSSTPTLHPRRSGEPCRRTSRSCRDRRPAR
jgi:hypothetical protein